MLLIDFINVGYGDAILLRAQSGGGAFTALVDCGDETTGAQEGNAPPGGGTNGSPGTCESVEATCAKAKTSGQRVSAAEFLQREGIEKLDLLVLTHLHKDHVGGLDALCAAVEVKEVWCNYLPPEKLWQGRPQQSATLTEGANSLIASLAIYTRALYDFKQKGTQVRCVPSLCGAHRFGELLLVAECAEPLLYVQQEEWFNGALQGQNLENLNEISTFLNNTSIRLFVMYNGFTVCLPGDVTADYWLKAPPGRCHVLKVPHHGHADALNDAVLGHVKPEYAVVSVSDDRTDNCPNPALMQTLQNSARLLFTDAVRRHSCVQMRIGEEIAVTE